MVRNQRLEVREMLAYRDLLGFYRAAIARCVDIMAMGEFNEDAEIEQGHHKDLIAITHLATGPMTLMNQNNSIYDTDLKYFYDEQRIILEKMSFILISLEDIDEELIKHMKAGRFAPSEDE